MCDFVGYYRKARPMLIVDAFHHRVNVESSRRASALEDDQVLRLATDVRRVYLFSVNLSRTHAIISSNHFFIALEISSSRVLPASKRFPGAMVSRALRSCLNLSSRPLNPFAATGSSRTVLGDAIGVGSCTSTVRSVGRVGALMSALSLATSESETSATTPSCSVGQKHAPMARPPGRVIRPTYECMLSRLSFLEDGTSLTAG